MRKRILSEYRSFPIALIWDEDFNYGNRKKTDVYNYKEELENSKNAVMKLKEW